MKESIKKRIEAVRRGEVPEGYSAERAMLFPNDWGEPVALNIVLSENKDRNEDLRFGKEDVLSVSGEQGIVNQITLLGRSYAGESVAPYHVVETGDVVYTKSPLKENPYGIIKQNRGAPGIVSTLYAVYHCSTPVTGQYLENYFCIDTYLNNYLKPLVKRGAKNDMKVNNEEVLLGRIPLPSLKEQERINEIIAQFDRIIELKQQLLEEKRRQKQWLMQTLLDPDSGVHLPGFETRVWKEIPLSEVFSYIRNGFVGTATPYYVDDGIPYIEGTNIQNGQWDLSEVLHISEEFHRKHPNSVLRTGDVVVVQSGHVGDCTVVTEKIDGSNSHAIIIMTPRPRVNPYFCACYINSPIGQGRLVGCITGNTVKHILASDMKKYLLPCPEKDEQDALANLFCAAEKEITAIEKEIDAWKQKKKALMQILLTGLVRV